MSPRRAWLLVAVLGVGLPAAVYQIGTVVGWNNPTMQAAASVLWPGVAAWFALGGSLFGGGFGPFGDAAIVIGVSGLAWAVLLSLGLMAWRAWKRARRKVARVPSARR